MSAAGEISMSRADVRRIGHDLARGAIGYVAGLWLLALIAGAILMLAFGRFMSTDASDRDGDHRSGFNLRTDYGTGCQYLETDKGSVTPRLDRAGHQICGAGK